MHHDYNTIDLDIKIREAEDIYIMTAESFSTYRVDGNIQEWIGNSGDYHKEGFGGNLRLRNNDPMVIIIDDLEFAIKCSPEAENNPYTVEMKIAEEE